MDNFDFFVQSILKRGLRCVAFDMDQTIVRAHSRGCLPKSGFADFASKIAPDFLTILPMLKAAGVKLAIATHSDIAEYDTSLQITPETHLLGEHLCQALLQFVVPQFAGDFFIVAYNPKARRTSKEHPGKNFHVARICEFYGIEASEVILFDDHQENIDLTLGCETVKVDPATGFTVSDVAFPWLQRQRSSSVTSDDDFSEHLSQSQS